MSAMRKALGSRGLSALIGLIVLVLFVVSVLFAFRAQYGLPGAPTTMVKAAFGEVGSLRVGDDVRVASSRVGSVDSVDYVDGRAVVSLKLDGERPIYKDSSASTASVGARSALGQKFVDLDPGTASAGALDAGGVIPERVNRGAQEVSDLFNVFDESTRTALGSTLRETGGGLAGHSQDLNDALNAAPTMLPDLGAVSTALTTDGGRDLTALLRSADALAGRFEGRQEEIATLMTNLSSTLDGVAVDGAKPFDETLQKAPDTLREAQTALDDLTPVLADTRSAVTVVRPGAEALGQATPDVRGVLREAVTPLDKVPGVADQAEPAVEELTGLMTDARPLTPRLVQTLRDAAPMLADVAPFSPEISHFFTNATSALGDGDAAGHWLRFFPIVAPETVSGILPVPDPTVARNGDPAPGELEQDRKPLPIIGGRR
ncbi:MlaD family protein [Pseudonocardia sp. WMMC193]|uniref:MlaD family protein n=1 Tax=Pseudonocardia sp. WMMC193 TaxID=2911965 RepID=UPI001F256219|nr:MlaD family protein [Pseudonocardia sp. WMMC193]MCF7550728.1 MlaD family protein [Pseudonocardia sp. WMMC193]